jgi:hypothetical protein
MLDKAKTADEALRAAGAHSLLKYASAEIELEVAKQEADYLAENRKINARSISDS